MSSWGTSEQGRGRARPGRGLRLPSFPTHKVYPEAGSSTVLSGKVRDPQRLQGIAGPLAGREVQSGDIGNTQSSLPYTGGLHALE